MILTDIITGKRLEVERHGKDRFGRTLAYIRISGADVGEMLITSRHRVWSGSLAGSARAVGLSSNCLVTNRLLQSVFRDLEESAMKKSHMRSTLLAIAAMGLLHVSAAAQDAGEVAAWEPLKASGSAQQLQAFLDAYPTGQFAPEARQKYSLTANMMLAPKVQHVDVRFPQEARDLGRSLGPIRVAKLSVLVQPDGKAQAVTLAESSGFDAYDEAAVAAARSATYLPGVDNGMAVESRLDYDVSFGFLCNRAAGDFTCDNGRFPTTCSATVCELLLR
jgi:TonB family protein